MKSKYRDDYRYYNPDCTAEEYKEMCYRHDWFYYMSDMFLSDVPANELLSIAESRDELKPIYNRAHAKRFNTESFTGTPGSEYYSPYKYPFEV